MYIVLAFKFLILFLASAFAEIKDLGQYGSLITNTLVEDGADCDIESFNLSVTTKLNSVFGRVF